METFRTLHGTDVPAMADATTLSPVDLGALLAFHHWRDFFRGRASNAHFRPSTCSRYFPHSELDRCTASHSYARHFYNATWRETAR